jgi:hypothetical protein
VGSITTKLTQSDLNDLEVCDGKHGRVDILISLYRYEEFKSVLVKSISQNACELNTFHVSLVESNEIEAKVLIDLIPDRVNLSLEIQPLRVGLYETWNSAIKAGNSELITNLNADDLRRPGSICAMAKEFNSNGKAEICYGNFVILDKIFFKSWQSLDLSNRKSQLGDFSLFDLVYRGNNKPHCAPMWKRSIHADLGYFNENLESSGDSDLWLRALVKGKSFHYTPMVTVAYFDNPQGLSSSLSSRGFREWNNILNNFVEKYPEFNHSQSTQNARVN